MGKEARFNFKYMFWSAVIGAILGTLSTCGTQTYLEVKNNRSECIIRLTGAKLILAQTLRSYYEQYIFLRFHNQKYLITKQPFQLSQGQFWQERFADTTIFSAQQRGEIISIIVLIEESFESSDELDSKIDAVLNATLPTLSPMPDNLTLPELVTWKADKLNESKQEVNKSIKPIDELLDYIKQNNSKLNVLFSLI